MKLIREVVEDVEYITENLDESTGKKNYFIEGIFLQAELKNRNGRRYPLDIVTNEVKRYNEQYVKENRAYGELGHPCFWDKTEALTDTGWKLIKNVSVGENVLTVNLDNNNAEFKPVKNVKILPYSGKLYHFKNRTIDTYVTPDHKFVIKERNGSLNLYTAQELYEGWQEGNSKFKHSGILKVSNGVQRTTDTITINGMTFDKNAFCKFLGFYLAEGHTKKRKKRNRSFNTMVYQKCPTVESFDKINNMLNSLHPDINFSARQTRDNFFTWTTCKVELCEWLHNLGICYTKYIPKEVIEQLDQESSLHLIDWFVIGDGRGNREDKFTKCNLFSTSKALRDDLSIACSIAGLNHRLYSHVPTKNSSIGERIILAENKHELFFIEILSSTAVSIDNRFLKIEEVDWNDNVYCLEMEDNPTFYAKDGGYAFWTGNCGPTINLDRASHIITELRQDGNNFVGRAKIMSTPMGEIVKNIIDEGGKIGVSSRGMGSLKQTKEGIMEVQNDFYLATAGDIVADPSAPDAFVRGIMEGMEWVYDIASQNWIPADQVQQVEEIIEDTEKQMKKMSTRELEEQKMQLLENFMKRLSRKQLNYK